MFKQIPLKPYWMLVFFSRLISIMKFLIYVALIVSSLLLPVIIAAPFYDEIIQDGIKSISESVGKAGRIDNNWLQNFQGMMQDGVKSLGPKAARQLAGQVIKQFREMIETDDNPQVIKDFAENLLMEFRKNGQ